MLEPNSNSAFPAKEILGSQALRHIPHTLDGMSGDNIESQLTVFSCIVTAVITKFRLDLLSSKCLYK